MGLWNDLNQNLRESSRTWVDWARRHAHDLGEASMRHLERQDLLSERKALTQRLGELVADRFLIEEKKTIRPDSPGFSEVLERVRVIDQRLVELSVADDETGDARDATPGDS